MRACADLSCSLANVIVPINSCVSWGSRVVGSQVQINLRAAEKCWDSVMNFQMKRFYNLNKVGQRMLPGDVSAGW